MTAGLAEAREAGSDLAATVAADLHAALPGSGGRTRVGSIGPMPGWLNRRLVDALEGIEVVDIGAAFRAMRLVKSEEELAWTRRSAALCDAGVAALVDAARPGVRDDELVAEVEQAYRRLGGEHGICFLASAPMSGGGRVVPSPYPSRRVLRAGDAVSIELSAGIGGTTGQILRTVVVGQDVPPAFQRVHEVADEAFASIAAAIKPGASAADLLAAAAVIDDAGFTVVDDVVHGYGGGYLPPVLRTPATRTRPLPDLRLEPGMLLVIQPNVVDFVAGIGVQTGELVAVSESGFDSMHSAEQGLLFASTPEPA
jgi:Xaa-Pro aminopeptidase